MASRVPALAAAGCMVLASAMGAAAMGGKSDAKADAPFDYYVLALSWSPSYCEDEGDDRNAAQCRPKRDYNFVVHGLWPQFEKGYPEFCDVRRRVPDDVADDMMEIMPARGLIFHQWKKHGTCTGLEPDAYFERTRDAYEAIDIPDLFERLSKDIRIDPQVIEDAFMEANQELDDNEISTICRSGKIREVRICLTPDTLEPRKCSGGVARDCREDMIRMPKVR